MNKDKKALLKRLQKEFDEAFKRAGDFGDRNLKLSEQYELGFMTGIYLAILKIRRLRM